MAKIEDAIDVQFWGVVDLGRPSDKQIALADSFGLDISRDTRRVGTALVSDILLMLNKNAIEREDLKQGTRVTNKWDKIGRVDVISSIQEDGTVYLKGGNGRRAWARNLLNLDRADCETKRRRE